MERVRRAGNSGPSGMLEPCSWFLQVAPNFLGFSCYACSTTSQCHAKPNKMHLLSDAALRKCKKLFDKVTQGRALSRSNQDIACAYLIATLPEELPQILSPQVSKARACRGRIATFVPFQLSRFFEVESLSIICATFMFSSIAYSNDF